MDPRSAYRLQVMEKLGGPLLAALPPGMDGEKSAETLAALVGKSVQAGLALAAAMKLSDEDGDIDSIRLALAAIAAPLLAQSYKDTGKLPDDAIVEQLVKGLEAALVFSENFTAAQEHTARLKSLHTPLPVIDTAQISLLSLNALTPVAVCLQQFSFGQSAPALIKQVGERLQKTARELAAASLDQPENGDRAFAELMVLRPLAELFAATHARLLANHKGDDAPALDAVWQAFDEQAAMMFALSGAAVDEAQQNTPKPSAPSSPTAEASAPPPPGNPMGFFKKGDDQAAAAPQAEAAPAQPAQEDQTDTGAQETSSGTASSSGGGSNPMSFFKKGG